MVLRYVSPMNPPETRAARAVLAVLTPLCAAAALAGPASAAPTEGYFTALPASGGTQMTQARSYATATTLSSGKVLIAGGYDGNFISTTETFDAAVPTFAGLPESIQRAYGVAAPLPGGNVLLAGGYPTYQLRAAEIFDEATNSSSGLPESGATQLTTARAGAVAAPLPDGRVLIAGGTPAFPPVGAVRTAEIYDPEANTFTALPASGDTQLTVPRRGAVAAPLPNGKVLIAGGTENADAPPILRSAELFDPATNTFTALPASGDTQLATARIGAAAAALPDGKVLIVGGSNDGTAVRQDGELFDPATSTFSPASSATSLGTGRTRLVAATLPDGTVLVTGGADGADAPQRSAELYVPAPSAVATGADFGDQTVAQASATQTITVTNLGAQSLELDAGSPSVTSTSGAAGDFTLISQTCTGAVLAFKGSCEVRVRFTPAALGARGARIVLPSNETDGTSTVELTGTGVPVPPPPAGPTGTTPATTGTGAAANTPAAKPKPKATCSAKRSRTTGRTRITCTVTGLPRKRAAARLSRNGATVATGRITAAGRLTITTKRRVRPGSYRLTVGTTKLTVRVR